ncbi:transglycosylase domain-containing protein [Streptomyces sp. NBC_01363]|uniref:transglycosylase domain-containing protein n=1 Tax=Streptomyces sp. NBC_01363 TaxID=2903840 RepID=UPI0022568F7A|nr:transglycosylase domain-containing protein [Streptomyces sp. NBC_01363]MCX4736471.1 transglycosylase domain-containing protein [Streptomyces sp. NBC_01363]
MTQHNIFSRTARAARTVLVPGTGRRKQTKRPFARLPRRPDYPRAGRRGWRRWVPSWRLVLGSVLMFTATLATVVGVAYARTDIPEDLNAFATQQDTVYYWADGTPMARTGWVSRQEMPLSKIPDHVRWAVLAAENANFYSDHGISTQGITRALWRTVGDGDTQGGSTITQQYVKNVYLTQDQSFSRKFTEMLLAVKLDSRLSKDKILQEYLNTSWFGRGTYGLQRASQAYYGKEVTQLNASEGAFLASLLKGASLYDPAVNPNNRKRAVARWRWTLDRMVEIGKLSPAERATYTTFPDPRPPHRPNSAGGQDGYLVQLAESYAKRVGHISDARFDLGGYQIYTTFEKPRMTALTRAVRDARGALDPEQRKADRFVRFGAASVAPDGRILAVYGGPDYERQAFNESNAGTVPAGSAFTPFVYAAGLQHGVSHQRNGPRSTVVPSTMYDGDDDIPVMTPEGPYWDRSGKMVKGNNDGDISHGRISLHDAMAKSVNSPFLQLGMDAGLQRVRSTAEASGLLPSSFGPPVPAFAMGNSTPSAIRMADAYGTFAAHGVHMDPYSVRKVTRNGEPVRLDLPRPRRAVRTDVADEVTASLSRPGGRNGVATPTPVAVKTGTTEDDTARWFVGYGPAASTAVVVYRMDLTKSLAPLPLKGLAGGPADDGKLPAQIWNTYTEAMTK